MVEIKILKAMMYQSKVVAPGEVIALGKADAALYEAKEAGRDRVALAA